MKDIILLKKEDFHTQHNNKFLPKETCNVTSAANFIEANNLPYFGFANEQLEDSLYKLLQSEYAKKFHENNVYWYKGVNHLQENIAMLAWAINIFSSNIFSDPVCKFGQIDDDDLIINIKNRKAVLILGDFINGKINSHYVTVIGRKGDSLLLADPFGNHNTKYKNKYGYCTKLPIKYLKKYWSGKYAITLI